MGPTSLWLLHLNTVTDRRLASPCNTPELPNINILFSDALNNWYFSPIENCFQTSKHLEANLENSCELERLFYMGFHDN